MYRVSNNGTTNERPAVAEIQVFSDPECSKEIVSTYVGESGYHCWYDSKGVYKDGSYAFDKKTDQFWSPNCTSCQKNEAWITFLTTENAECVTAENLGYKYYDLLMSGAWNHGITVELKMPDGSWKPVLTSQKGNLAKPLGITLYLYYLSLLFYLKILHFNVTYVLIFIVEGIHLKPVKPFPTLTLFMKGGNESLTYYGPRDLVNLVTFVNDGTEFFLQGSPKVGN